MNLLKRLFSKQQASVWTPWSFTEFEERPVPMEIRQFGIVRNFCPIDRQDYRVVVNRDGHWSVFPSNAQLTTADYAGIKALREREEQSQ